jgi:hypothetical protein
MASPTDGRPAQSQELPVTATSRSAAPPPTGQTRPTGRVTGTVTAVLHLLALWPYAISGLVAPGWGVGALLVVWAGFGVVAFLVHRRWGGLATLVPLLAVGAWFGLVTLGEQLLGWTG